MNNNETVVQTEKKEETKDLIKDLISKARVQYAWYIDMYPNDMRDGVAQRLIQLEANHVVSCADCGIPSGMSGITMRVIKFQDKKGKKQKINLCPHCLASKINQMEGK